MPSRSRKLLRLSLKALGLLLLFIAAAGAGTLTFFHFASPQRTCGSCHEMQTHIDQWASSAHQGVHCRQCHGGTLTLDLHALRQHVRRLVGHFGSARPQEIRLSHKQVLAVSGNCQSCHSAEYERWKSGGHSATFSTILLNARHNHSELLNADCLRCHGMFFPGSTDALVTPVNLTGPWTLRQPELANEPTMPCLTCHRVHAERASRGSGASPAATLPGAPAQSAPALERPTPAVFYSRHEKAYFAPAQLPIPAMFDGSKPLRVSSDPRQRVCMQCHAPDAFHHAGSEDDRTPTGVHEGLSCLDCHDPHATTPLATCADCHAGKTIKSPEKKVHAPPAAGMQTGSADAPQAMPSPSALLIAASLACGERGQRE
jgi:hypothetical protein